MDEVDRILKPFLLIGEPKYLILSPMKYKEFINFLKANGNNIDETKKVIYQKEILIGSNIKTIRLEVVESDNQKESIRIA